MKIKNRHIFLICIVFLPVPLLAQNTIDVTFRYLPSENAVRSFVPGSFNNWGSNTSGQINPANVSVLVVDEEHGFSYQVVEMEVGGGSESYEGAPGYGYKFHEHYNQSGTEWQWFTDPLNPIAIGDNNDSFIEVTHPLIFQVEPAANTVHRTAPPGITATVAAIDGDPINVTESAIYVNGVLASSFEGFYESERQLLMIASLSDLGIGENTIRIAAVTNDGASREKTISFTWIATPDVPLEPRPHGLEDGITYYDDDPSKVSFSIFAPGKEFVHLIGDHSNWQAQEAYLMKLDAARPDSAHFWITLNDFTPGQTYRFQYLIDGEIRVADPFSELVLHPVFDQYISESVYPGMPEYPAGLTTDIVSVIEPGREPYPWQAADFERPMTDELLIYELLLRDFVEESTYDVLRDTLAYLENLGVNVIELMPISEFDGNLSWGYNPVFHGALDKSYGSRRAFKRFVDEAHTRGIAVVLDVVYNHAHDHSPLIRTFGTNRSGSFENGNPLLGPGHAYNVFYHLNHDHPYIQYWLDRMNRYWMETYNIDGFRFDLTKGFASNVSNQTLLDGYNPQRIANLKRMADAIWAVDEDVYIILEHFAANQEERELEEYGMLLWGNHNYNYSEAVMGWNQGGNSDMSGMYFKNRNFENPRLIGYMESHDEQWLMHKAANFGNQSAPGHNVRDLDVALERMKLAGAFFFTIPGPKMLWQFGELGYGWRENECLKPGDGSDGDCLASDPGRTDEKPIRWEYYHEENRHRLYRAWSELIRLRNTSPVFTSRNTNFSSSLNGNTKWIALEHDDMNVLIVGNFDVNAQSMTAAFPAPGEWFEFTTGTLLQADTAPMEFELDPAEFRIYTSREIEPAEPGLFFPPDEDQNGTLPDEIRLHPNFPNPFNTTTQLTYDVPEENSVTITVYDLIGRQVATLVDIHPHQPGTFTVSFDASSLGSGVYIARLVSGNASRIQKMMLIK